MTHDRVSRVLLLRFLERGTGRAVATQGGAGRTADLLDHVRQLMRQEAAPGVALRVAESRRDMTGSCGSWRA